MDLNDIRLAEGKQKREYAKMQFQIHQMYANWWIAAASNGHAGTRKMYHGTLTSGGPAFTPEELRDDAMNIAKNHIHICSEIMEHLSNE